jgi:hypothetical protein
MAKVFRRSWEKWVLGRNGAISNVQAARSGTDGVISGAAYSGNGTAIFQSASASFASTDVGRKIRLLNTPNKRFDGLYVVDSINSSTSANLRYSHNVTGAAPSPARFFENGSSITWRIHESCTFTADAANDIQGWHPGSFMNIEGATNVGNKGQWLISHVLTNQTCILSKSPYFWVADVQGNYSTFIGADGVGDGFAVESGLQWSITDPEPLNGIHSVMLMVQQLIDSGWQVWQTRGNVAPSGTTAILHDIVLRSTGETDAALPSGKVMYLRVCLSAVGRTATGVWGQVQFSSSFFLHWDITGTAGGIPGNGLAPMRLSANNTVSISPSPVIPGSSSVDVNLESSFDILSPGRAGQTASIVRRDHVVISDADEFTWYYNNTGRTNQAFLYGGGAIKPIGQNQNTVAITAVTSGSGPYTVHTGTMNLGSLGYQVGDNICIRGLSTSPAEYLETTIITGFDSSNPLDNIVFVQSLSQVYGQGSDSVKGFIGEDPYLVGMWTMTTNTMTNRFHNAAKLGNATGHDWDATNFGSTGTNVAALSSFSELIPNRRSGRFGVSTLLLKNSVNSEFRGRSRYQFITNTEKIPQGKKLQNPVDSTVYVVVCLGIFSNQSVLLGPIPKLQAGVR